jgi:hypothetical protein
MAEKTEEELVELEAEYGERMIEVRVRFFTNGIAGEKGKIRPKHALTEGVARIAPNKSHGIVQKKLFHFDSLLDLGHAIQRVLIDEGIVLHPSGKMKKYIKDRPS